MGAIFTSLNFSSYDVMT
ncbi:hypothetical protein F383_05292 [Gossypium arboreum]|uniref:Uncharacterized protein n=1 Tax=Gossypium arboreum TaxID=29729 RepID=A0A0B0PTZ5_GOSAR|nr:hypothetical protein F383_05292 [Gossypium arboreum]